MRTEDDLRRALREAAGSIPDPVPDAARSVIRRGRRQRLVRAVPVALTLVLVAVTFAGVVSRGRHPASVAVTTGPVTTAASRPEGPPVDPSTLGQLAFVDPTHGFAVTRAGQLTASTDGGEDWYVELAIPSEINGAPALTGVRFIDPLDGIAFGHARYVTHDRGHTWLSQPVSRGAVITDVDAAGGVAWAIEQSAGSGEAVGGRRPPLVERSTDQGRTWVSTASPQVPLGDGSWFVALSPTLAYFVGNGPQVGSATASPIRVTTDGGQRWAPVADPCPSFAVRTSLDGSSPSDLWVFCTGQAAGSTTAEQVYRSADGGAHWTLSASCQCGIDNIANVGVPPGGGGPPVSAAVLNPQQAWVMLGRSGPWGTIDGGRTWSQPFGHAYDSGEGDMFFLDPSHGWIEAGGVLWRTTDGTTWRALTAQTRQPTTRP